MADIAGMYSAARRTALPIFAEWIGDCWHANYKGAPKDVAHRSHDNLLGFEAAPAEPVAAQAYHGNLLIKRASWNDDLMEELCLFPAAQHDDQVDALSGAFARLLMPIGEFSVGFYDF